MIREVCLCKRKETFKEKATRKLF